MRSDAAQSTAATMTTLGCEEFCLRRHRCHSVNPMKMPDSNSRRGAGCLCGGAIGDAWGSAYEGMVAPVAVELRDDWSLTDDTQLTLATCEAIVAARGVSPESIAAEMARAFRAGTLVGLGASTYQAL